MRLQKAVDSQEIKTWADIISSVATTVAITAGALWFLITTKFRPRLQFDLGCNFVPLKSNPDYLIAELQLIFENPGFIEYRFHNLNVSVHALEREDVFTRKDTTDELVFKTRLLPETEIVRRLYRYYFIRPGARQIITHIITIPASVSAIRITSSFNYRRTFRRSGDPHTARRVFRVEVTRGRSLDY